MSTAPHQDPAVIELGRVELSAMREAASSLLTASLLSDDGFEVVRVAESNAAATDGGRFASMASSIQALSEAVGRELAMGAGEYVIIAAERGHLIQMRIPGSTIVLAALFDTDEMLGKALTVARRCSTRIGEGLAQAQRTPTAATF
ncbi:MULTISPECIES: hypothetical protein [unclassified Curtobacterium]|uniref:roadblock/LC7 domain-containing protein n=1 Tax=unclassified Curtobacterium TaxID=257496 RepID=UPI0008DE43E1|nr:MULTISPECIES: hypothetical protein [unclassified Curtobacterium]OIH99442.1 hypothetical protein BIU92_00610 [Curtobacterium sp. MCBA15_003]OII11346.1 hypothetical protein BIU97_05410 [Curtobacterium sp. MCBA15_009]OII30727.1 hypothetical protein BIU94_08285 [Curtobacterium sp. MMLR14_006]